MNELEKILNEPEAPKQTETNIPKQEKKPTAAANRAKALAEQDNSIAAASIGGAVFRSAKTFLEASPEIKGYQK